MREVRRAGPPALLPDELPRHLLGIGDPDDLLAGVARGIDTFDCATPTRLARHGTALVPDPQRRWRLDVSRAAATGVARAARGRLPVPGLPRAHPRLPALPGRAGELTAVRLLDAAQPDLHGALMEGLRAAVAADALEAYGEELRRGEAPYVPSSLPDRGSR